MAIHPHMWSKFENRKEIDFVFGNTDPKHVWAVLDTGHITMAGINPVELTGKLRKRIVEFHLKDTKPEHRGGAATFFPGCVCAQPTSIWRRARAEDYREPYPSSSIFAPPGRIGLLSSRDRALGNPRRERGAN